MNDLDHLDVHHRALQVAHLRNIRLLHWLGQPWATTVLEVGLRTTMDPRKLFHIVNSWNERALS